ncbi:hypothetical protein OUZ56_005189 [Daphnia magna]|uniref:Uncharacterized protein n=1 Tax=Daphnia magna TaxID=35525 RepID=A0ABQ9YS36_9CRUS|nr:hypothetical protein OUZ56_005189 [Daphnia magna]
MVMVFRVVSAAKNAVRNHVQGRRYDCVARDRQCAQRATRTPATGKIMSIQKRGEGRGARIEDHVLSVAISTIPAPSQSLEDY